MRIGIIGLGDMGLLMAKLFTKNGLEVLGSDLPEVVQKLQHEMPVEKLRICKAAEAIEQADYVLFCVETDHIEAVVKAYAGHFRPGQVVGGQTSVKTPEIYAFEQYLPQEVEIVTLHSLHGPQVDPAGQTLLIVPHRCSESTLQKIVTILKCTESKLEIVSSVSVHDKMMADVQVVTHIGFESIGTSFMHRGVYPWENPLHTSGLDNLKMVLTLRIFSYKHHVYSGLAMMNPFSKADVRTYAKAENDLFGLMIAEEKEEFFEIIFEAKRKVFGAFDGKLMLNDELMAEFSLHETGSHKPNSHLSLLAMVLTWARLGICPYQNLVCQTPPFKLRVGMAEYLFMNDELLAESLHAALFDKSIRKDDLAFHTAVQEWAHIIESGDKLGYEMHFEKTKAFLSDRLDKGKKLSGMLIERLNNEKS